MCSKEYSTPCRASFPNRNVYGFMFAKVCVGQSFAKLWHPVADSALLLPVFPYLSLLVIK